MVTTLPPPADAFSRDELEQSFAIQRKALLILVREGRNLSAIRRTACWLQLESLHGLDPARYPEPQQLHDQLVAQDR